MLRSFIIFIESKIRRVLVIFYLIFISIIILFSADIFSPWRSFTNKSDSMNPAINRGSITIVKSFLSYKIGDAIAYYAYINDQEEIVTHRVMDIGGNVYTTKGDANDVADRELVKPRLVIGKVVFIIPYLGYIITFVKSLVGTWLCIIIPALIIIGTELLKIHQVLKNIKGQKVN